ncbi:MAG: hypothetical protein ACRDQA_05905, partial [Nocardioidaceae bacterium]
VLRWVSGKSDRTGLGIGGLVVSGLGIVGVVVGLYLASGVSDAGSQADQGDKAVTATMVTGGGFILLAIGLVIGLWVLRGSGTDSSSSSPASATGGFAGW